MAKVRALGQMARCVTQQAVPHWLTARQLVLFQFIFMPGLTALPVYQSPSMAAYISPAFRAGVREFRRR